MCNPCYQRWLYSRKKKGEEFYKKKREQSRRYYEKNKERVLRRQGEWRSENPEEAKRRVRESMRRRRRELRREGLGYNDDYLFGNNRKEVYERDGYSCVDCGLTNAESLEKYGEILTVHHIDGKGTNEISSSEKNNDVDNLVTLCRSCHVREHRRLSDGRGRVEYSAFVS